MRIIYFLFFFWWIVGMSCLKETPLTMVDTFPKGFPTPIYNFDSNTFSETGFELGRALFYDPILSKDSTISCASCHQQKVAFADAAQSFSEGVGGKLGFRNSPPIFNHRWFPSFFWDGGGSHIELVPHNALTSELEMGETLGNVLKKLQQHPVYAPWFERVFNQTTISSQKLFFALAQFTASINSTNSKYDQYINGIGTFTSAEMRGHQLFLNHCSTCHTPPLFTDFSYQNNGLDTVFKDEGRRRITLKQEDLGKFRVPTLRNIAVTAPYMHDGRFPTLAAAVSHYTSSILSQPSLASSLENGIQLSEAEQKDLIAFLHTLTDEVLLTNDRFSNPFE